MRAVRLSARPAVCMPSARRFATQPPSASSSSRLTRRSKPAAAPLSNGDAAAARLGATPSRRTKLPDRVPSASSAGDALMAKFAENSEELSIPLVQSREEFGKKYLYEIITMPIRTPAQTFRAMVEAFDDEAEKSFFLSRSIDQEKNVHLYIDLLGETKRIDRMREFLKELRTAGKPIHERIYASAINACGSAGRAQDAVELEQEMIQHGMQPDNYICAAMVRAFAKSGQFEEAEKRLKELNAITAPETKEAAKVAYTSLISSYVTNHLYDKAWEKFNYMRTYISLPDIVTYTTMIKACAATGQAERALNFYQEMRQLNLQPTEVTFFALINACARRLEFLEEAFMLHQTMKSLGFVPTANVYGSLLLAAANGGDIARITSLLREIEEENMPVEMSMRTTVIKGYAKAMKGKDTKTITGYILEAQKQFDLGMRDAGKEPDHEKQALCHSMIVCLATALRPKKALALFYKMLPKYGVSPGVQAYSAIVQMWIRYHNFDEAQEWLKKLLAAGFQPPRQIYLMFIDHTARSGLTNMSLMFLRALVTKFGEKPKREEVRSLWNLGKEDLGVRRELELCLQPRHYVRPQNRPEMPNKGARMTETFLPPRTRLPPLRAHKEMRTLPRHTPTALPSASSSAQ